MSEIAVRTDPAQPTSLLAVVERAATNPDVDVNKLRELLQMAREERTYNAEVDFNEAMVRAQGEIGRIAADRENTQTRSSYATYAALDRVVRPAYVREGFSLSFNTGDAPELAVLVLCYVSHKGGHTRTYQALVPADGKGAKGGDVMTKTHAVGSAMAYGKRYLLKLIFNIAEGIDPEDDDGNGADDGKTAEEQEASRKAAAALDTWLDQLNGADTLDALRKHKDAIRKDYAGMVPQALLSAYSARLHALTPAK